MKRLFPLITFCLLLFTSCNSQHTTNTTLEVADFANGIAQPNIQILDVRTPNEYQSGHLKNALLADWNNTTEFEKRAAALDKSKPVYAYCLSGARSNAATEWLNQHGYKAYNLAGGINAWLKADQPIEQTVPVKQMTLTEFNQMIPLDKTVLVDFGATWCPPCKAMAPIIDSFAKQNNSKWVLIKIDGGDQTDLANLLKIEGFPTFIVYKKGKEVWRKQGMVDVHVLTKAIE